MKISEYKNSFSKTFGQYPDNLWISVRGEPFTIYGLCDPCDGTPFHRFAPEVGKAISKSVDELNYNPAGGRVTFMTDSPYIALYATFPILRARTNMSPTATVGFDVYTIGDDGSQCFIGCMLPDLDSGKNEYMYSINSRTRPGVMKKYLIHFPIADAVNDVYVGIDKDARLMPCPSPYHDRKPLIFYGSSITQGCSVSHPGYTYENHISRRLRMDYLNFGLSGNGKAEDAIVDYMAGLEMSVFISDYDFNAPDCEYLEKTHHRMYEKIRAAHPDVPYIMITKPDCDMHPKTDAARREVIRRPYEKAVSAGDKNVYFIDGATLFGDVDRDSCFGDNVHPNDIGHYRMANVIGEVIKSVL
ncbi:MAG: SGNH/GDSL hydrolase family protein [Clostridia bacterium]|nr:SGNH/GDSL hydrolase family protein [Clostridia bacterium]